VRAPPVPSAPMSGSDGPAQQLAGLFAGGMPTLKKTGGGAARTSHEIQQYFLSDTTQPLHPDLRKRRLYLPRRKHHLDRLLHPRLLPDL